MFSPAPQPTRLDDLPESHGHTTPRIALGAATAATVPTALISGSVLAAAIAGLLVLLAVAIASILI
ncbi:putative membrane protein [Rhodococcus opacus]|uniref:Putative membrane protein n=1 Tax=Rhodococcus opacus TaxID=37919 RepID=A0A1B1KFD2_RHOOP|nr:hypothetical protein [Rhodococcus opacus]ANS31332.1 putative membrane protein [Rhodococcus opacus]